MNKKELFKLLTAAATNQASGNFSSEDVNQAAINALSEYLDIDVNDGRSLRKLSNADFGIIEEVIQEVTPKQLENVIGDFAEIRTFGRNEQVLFTIKSLGGGRVKRAIVPGARGGVYQSRRLDNRNLVVETAVETVGITLTLEDLLTGRVTLADYMRFITEGFEEIVYIKVVQALRAAANTAPTANKASYSGGAFDTSGLDHVLRVVGAYGTPRIFAFENMATQISNTTNFITGSADLVNTAREDWDNIRDYGRVMKYKGRAITVIPNFIANASNSEWLFKEDTMFILPASEKPVKVAFHGDLVLIPNTIVSGGYEWFAHRELGVAVIADNAIGSVTDEDMDGGIY